MHSQTCLETIGWLSKDARTVHAYFFAGLQTVNKANS